MTFIGSEDKSRLGNLKAKESIKTQMFIVVHSLFCSKKVTLFPEISFSFWVEERVHVFDSFFVWDFEGLGANALIDVLIGSVNSPMLFELPSTYH